MTLSTFIIILSSHTISYYIIKTFASEFFYSFDVETLHARTFNHQNTIKLAFLHRKTDMDIPEVGGQLQHPPQLHHASVCVCVCVVFKFAKDKSGHVVALGAKSLLRCPSV